MLAERLDRLANERRSVTRFERSNLDGGAEVRERLVGKLLEALHVVQPSENDAEAALRVAHELSERRDHLEAIARIRVQEIIGLVEEHGEAHLWVPPEVFTDRGHNFLRASLLRLKDPRLT